MTYWSLIARLKRRFLGTRGFVEKVSMPPICPPNFALLLLSRFAMGGGA